MKYHLQTIALRALLLLILFSLPFIINAQQPYTRANLNIIAPDGSTVLMDGNLTNYDDIYSNNVDIDDAWKMSNFSENFGISRQGQNLIVERRKMITTTDTTFFKIWNMSHPAYQLEFILRNFSQPRLYARLKDTYEGIETDIRLNDTTRVNFSVNNDPASYNSMRFQLIYYTINTASVPVSFIDFKTWRAATGVEIEWSVINEVSVEKYIIEHSADGSNFVPVQTIAANNAGTKSYSFTHEQPLPGDNFYRIKAIRLTGSIEHSAISKVSAADLGIRIYPNPVVGKTFQLRTDVKEPGLYNLSLVSSNGIVYPLKPVTMASGQSLKKVELPLGAMPGIYRLKIIGPGNQQQILTVYIM